MPGVDRRVVPAERGAVAEPWLGLLAAQPPRREDPHILDRFAVEQPAEMPLALGAAIRAVGSVIFDVGAPGPDELSIKVQFGSESRVRPRGVQSLFQREIAFKHEMSLAVICARVFPFTGQARAGVIRNDERKSA